MARILLLFLLIFINLIQLVLFREYMMFSNFQTTIISLEFISENYYDETGNFKRKGKPIMLFIIYSGYYPSMHSTDILSEAPQETNINNQMPHMYVL